MGRRAARATHLTLWDRRLPSLHRVRHSPMVGPDRRRARHGGDLRPYRHRLSHRRGGCSGRADLAAFPETGVPHPCVGAPASRLVSSTACDRRGADRRDCGRRGLAYPAGPRRRGCSVCTGVPGSQSSQPPPLYVLSRSCLRHRLRRPGSSPPSSPTRRRNSGAPVSGAEQSGQVSGKGL